MFSYVTFGTNDFTRAIAFYDAVMQAVGHKRCHSNAEEGWYGWGTYEDDGVIQLALWVCKPVNGQPATNGNGTMVAFSASTPNAVDAFHRAGIAHGGTSEGAPGYRDYGKNFYAGYLRDPDGNKIAAVCRAEREPDRPER